MGRRLHSALDVWEVTIDDEFEPVEDSPLCTLTDGFICWAEAIGPDRLRLVVEAA